jgi:quinol monooxygenase YgiN
MTESVQTEATTPGAWAPLRHRVFRMLWIAQVVSLVGTWAQTVGAQWFLTIESGRPELVALVQTATSLPVLLLALPAGALADVLDRRRMLIVVQAGMAVVAVALAVDTLTGHLGTVALLAFTAARWPTPELVLDPDEQSGAFLVTVEYRVLPDRVEDFVEAMGLISRSRLRTGALRWGLYRDGLATDRFLELYLLPSWREHLRHHEHRQTVTDRIREEALAKLLVGPPRTSHLFSQRAPSS